MATTTQYNPVPELNATLAAAGASKTVYALVTPETEATKNKLFGETSFLAHADAKARRADYLGMFRDAWTGKQDAVHTEFFDMWHRWSAPVVDLDRTNYPFFYPCNGASEPIRHLIYDMAARTRRDGRVHVFEGEYEGYKAMAEAAGLKVIEHKRNGRNGWHTPFGMRLNRIDAQMGKDDLFFVSQPSAIDGDVWHDFNEFVAKMQPNTVVADVTYVGAVPDRAVVDKFNLNSPAIRNVIFSLSKPFGVYYDRIGGVFCREEDSGLFGNKWFKNLTSIKLGTLLMQRHGVFDLAHKYAEQQEDAVISVSGSLGFDFRGADVFILATADTDAETDMANYLRRAGKLRVCVTQFMADLIGTAGKVE